LLCGALFGVPLLLLQNGPVRAQSASASVSDHGRTSHAAWSPSRLDGVLLHSDLVRYGSPIATTTTTSTVPVTTTTEPPTTTTTEAPVVETTTTAPPPVAVATSGNTESGGATYYASYFPASGCASPNLPKGTVLTVTAADGSQVVCTVDDKEADNPRRVVDLSPTEFSELAPLSQGVVEVTVTW
jgi:rare lipoprotein A (peptidoglycan hydrolase)